MVLLILWFFFCNKSLTSQNFLDFLKARIWFLLMPLALMQSTCGWSTQFPVVLFMMLYKVILTFDSEYEILWCEHSNETSFAVLEQKTFF